MPNIVLTHPVHGAKVAISEQEARQDMLHGWQRFVQPVVTIEPEIPAFLTQLPDVKTEPVADLQNAVESSLNTLIPRRGRRKQEG